MGPLLLPMTLIPQPRNLLVVILPRTATRTPLNRKVKNLNQKVILKRSHDQRNPYKWKLLWPLSSRMSNHPLPRLLCPRFCPHSPPNQRFMMQKSRTKCLGVNSAQMTMRRVPLPLNPQMPLIFGLPIETVMPNLNKRSWRRNNTKRRGRDKKHWNVNVKQNEKSKKLDRKPNGTGRERCKGMSPLMTFSLWMRLLPEDPSLEACSMSICPVN